MSSYSTSEFITELKAANAVISSFSDADVATFLGIAFRKYSAAFPELRLSPDNEIVDGQELYDFPEGALKITKIMDSDSHKEIGFVIETPDDAESVVDQIRLGNILRTSVSDLLQQDYYSDPVATASSSEVVSYDTFDIEYSILQTIDTIKDTGLDAVGAYVEYLACNNKAGEVAIGAADSSERVAEQIIDQDSSGASTTIKYAASKDMANTLRQQATDALARYNEAAGGMAYGTRG